MSWQEIKNSYGKSLDALKANKTPLYIAFVITLLQTLYTYMPATYGGIQLALTVLSVPVAWIGAVWIQQSFDQSYGNRKIVDSSSILQGFGKMILLILLFIAVLGAATLVGVGLFMISAPVAFLVLIPSAIVLLYVMLRIIFASQVAVLENRGPINAIKESWALTQNRAWKVFGFFMALAGIGILAMLIVALFSLLGGTISAVAYLIVYTGVTALYAGMQVAFFRMLQKKDPITTTAPMKKASPAKKARKPAKKKR